MSAPRHPPELREQIQRFLALNRRRTRGGPPLDARERAQWGALRRQLEETLAGQPRGSGPERCALRVPTQLVVDYSDPQIDEERSSAHEIAERGLFLASPNPHAVGAPLRLKLYGDDGERVEVEGVVVWVRREPTAEGPAGMGVQFGKLDDAQREAVAYLVEEALAAL